MANYFVPSPLPGETIQFDGQKNHQNHMGHVSVDFFSRKKSLRSIASKLSFIHHDPYWLVLPSPVRRGQGDLKGENIVKPRWHRKVKKQSRSHPFLPSSQTSCLWMRKLDTNS